MLHADLIERVGMDDPEVDNRERKYYRLTRLGRQILFAETKRLRQLLNLANDIEVGDNP
jgi:DNA-binding PadR family transcriptional regulator